MTQSQNCFSLSRGLEGCQAPKVPRPFLTPEHRAGTGLMQADSGHRVSREAESEHSSATTCSSPPRDARPGNSQQSGQGAQRTPETKEGPGLQSPSPAPRRKTQLPSSGEDPLPVTEPSSAPPGAPLQRDRTLCPTRASPPDRTLCPNRDPSPDRTLCPAGDPSPG